MTNKEIGLELLAVKDSIDLHKHIIDTLLSLKSYDAETFTYHVKQNLETMFETLKNEAHSLDELAGMLLKEQTDEKNC